jgi:hypothetical protein
MRDSMMLSTLIISLPSTWGYDTTGIQSHSQQCSFELAVTPRLHPLSHVSFTCISTPFVSPGMPMPTPQRARQMRLWCLRRRCLRRCDGWHT